MKNWYFDLPEFKAELGFEFRFYGEGRNGEKYLHICTITEVYPGKNSHIPGDTMVKMGIRS